MPQFQRPFQPPQVPSTGHPQWQQPPQQWYPPPQPSYYQPPPQYMLQPFYQPPVPVAPPPKSKTLLTFIIGAFSGVLVMVIILAVIIGVASQSKDGNTTTVPEATQQSQPTATPIPTPTDTPVPAINQAVVGGTEAAFTAKYGDPTSSQTEQNGTQEILYYTGNSDIGGFGLVLLPGTITVYGIVIVAPTGQSWDATTATTVCISYLPSDSKLDQPQDVTDSTGSVVGVLEDGYSAELANSLSPAYFNDGNSSSLVKPGTFSIKFTYVNGSDNTATACAIRLGIQSTSA